MKSRFSLAMSFVLLVASGCASDGGESSEVDFASSTTAASEAQSTLPASPEGSSNPDFSAPEWQPLPAGTPSGVGPSAYRPDRSRLIAGFFALSEVAEPAESVAFFATNIPEGEVRTCMEVRGFTYLEDLSPEQMVAMNPFMSLSREEFARQYGFGISAVRLAIFPEFPPNPNDSYVESLSSAEQAAWNEAVRNCRNMTTDGATYSTALNTATAEFREALNADDRIIAATEQYGSCMAAAGFDFDSPLATRGHFASLAAQATSSVLEEVLQDEIRAAVADSSCGEPLIEMFRTVAMERFAEFESMLDAALANPSSGQPQG
jgi:hypothetical protein